MTNARLVLGLTAALLVARGLALWDRLPSASPIALLALAWQDALLVVVFALVVAFVSSRAIRLTLFLALVALAAINVPVIRTLGSPLTVPMLRATGGALADSIAHQATWYNVLALLAVVASGLAPLTFARTSRGSARRTATMRGWLLGATAVGVSGGMAATHVPTRGLDRTGVVALISTMVPRVHASLGTAGDWRLVAAAPAAVSTAASNGAVGGDALRAGADGPDLRALVGSARGANVVLVVLESTAAQYLKPWGGPTDPMPRLSALARESIVFENAYTAYPESVKGLVATLASRYPAFDVPAERHASAMSASLADALQRDGYRTGLFHSGRFMYLGMEQLLAKSGFGTLDDAGAIGGNRESSFGVDDAATVQHLLKWIDNRGHGTPFFAAYLPISGHHPYMSARPAAGPTDRDRYLAALGESDAALGDLLDGLSSRGLRSNTMLVVVGDHGEAFGQHVGNDGHTLALYEENVKVPLLIAAPHTAAVRVPRVVSTVDIAPTVLALLGRPAPASWEGSSALEPVERRALFFTDYSQGLLGLREGCLKYIGELSGHHDQLFDLCRDPGERSNLADHHVQATTLERYRATLRAWSAAGVRDVAALQRERVTPIPRSISQRHLHLHPGKPAVE